MNLKFVSKLTLLDYIDHQAPLYLKERFDQIAVSSLIVIRWLLSNFLN